MVSEQETREDGLTTDDVLDRHTAEPMQEVRMLPEWEEWPEEQPGENTHIDGDELVWERDGFEVRLRSYETTHWKADLTVPREIGSHFPRPVDLKSRPKPKYGFVDTVDLDEYAAVGVTLVLQENFIPTVEINGFIDGLIEQVDENEQFKEDLESKLSAARENESEVDE
jgi:hypothetical protein